MARIPLSWFISMNIDLASLNTFALALVIIALMIIIGVTRKHIGARWITVTLELLLLSILIRRLDEISNMIGLDLIDQVSSIVLQWLVLLIMVYEFAAAWKRRRELRRIETKLREREAELEALRKTAEYGIGWDY